MAARGRCHPLTPTEARSDDATSAPESGGRYAKYVLFVLILVNVFNFIDRQILSILGLASLFIIAAFRFLPKDEATHLGRARAAGEAEAGGSGDQARGEWVWAAERKANLRRSYKHAPIGQQIRMPLRAGARSMERVIRRRSEP